MAVVIGKTPSTEEGYDFRLYKNDELLGKFKSLTVDMKGWNDIDWVLNEGYITQAVDTNSYDKFQIVFDSKEADSSTKSYVLSDCTIVNTKDNLSGTAKGYTLKPIEVNL